MLNHFPQNKHYDLNQLVLTINKPVAISLVWETYFASTNPDTDYELDLSAFLLGINGKLLEEGHFVFYNNPVSPDKAVTFLNTETTEQPNQYRQILTIDLSLLSQAIAELVFVVTLHKASERKQNFGQLRRAAVVVYNPNMGEEWVRYNLSECLATESAVEFIRLYQRQGHWKIQAVGESYLTDLEGILARFYDGSIVH